MHFYVNVLYGFWHYWFRSFSKERTRLILQSELTNESIDRSVEVFKMY